MESTLNSNRKTARLAGFLFIFLCVPLAIWGLSYVPSWIFVSGDAVATANNLLAYEFLFRTGIVSHLIGTTAFALMVLLLYRLFSPIDKNFSRMMVASALAQVPIVLVLEVCKFAALMILKGEVLTTFDLAQKQEFAFLLLRVHGYGIAISQIFWGLCFLPLGVLVYRSGFTPRVFGILLIICGIGYIVEGCAFILLQRPDYLIVRQFARYTFIGGPLTLLWFLIKGVRDPKATAQ